MWNKAVPGKDRGEILSLYIAITLQDALDRVTGTRYWHNQHRFAEGPLVGRPIGGFSYSQHSDNPRRSKAV